MQLVTQMDIGCVSFNFSLLSFPNQLTSHYHADDKGHEWLTDWCAAFCFLVALEQTSTTRYSAFNIHCNRVCLRVLAPAITHAELDHCRSLPLWAERGPALLFVHSVHRDEPNDLLDTLPDTLPQGNHYLTGITGLNWAKNRTQSVHVQAQSR